MLIDKINLNHLRVFEAIYRTGSTLAAAAELHLTQSGVSQHLKTLEEQLGKELFDRLNRKLIPTQESKLLFEQCQKGFLHIETAIGELTGQREELRGSLAVGVPTEFGNNLVIEGLAQFAVANPKVHLEIHYGLAEEMSRML
ncbi:MAG: LysR family transcriptional regulator, partial [Pseudomonadota bacterium]